MRLSAEAPAKINLWLQITGRRPDGYHLLDSLVIFAGAADILTAEPGQGLSLDITGPFSGTLAAEPDNLVLRAARALAEAANLPPAAHLILTKNLPVASGIGGGSADAAATLRVLSKLWRLTLPESHLSAIAATLGADIPVCLHSHPTRMSGIGECLTPVPPLPPMGLVLVNPGLALATARVFAARTGPFTRPAAIAPSWPDLPALIANLAQTSNDLEPPALQLCPPIAEILSALRANPTCRLARMSGSGATCFALYDTPETAQSATTHLKHPTWWVWGGAVRGFTPT